MVDNSYGGEASFEVERKYDVGAEAILPERFESVGLTVIADEVFELVTSYFDTPTNDIAKQRIALRKREGSPDAGWHIKIKKEAGNNEYLWPLTDAIPAGAIELLREITGMQDLALEQIATLRTTRRQLTLADESGKEMCFLVDDNVAATNERQAQVTHWREWEAEVSPGGDAQLLNKLEPLLKSAGAVTASASSKIARAMQ